VRLKCPNCGCWSRDPVDKVLVEQPLQLMGSSSAFSCSFLRATSTTLRILSHSSRNFSLNSNLPSNSETCHGCATTWELLKKYGIAYANMDEPLLPPEVHLTADFAYFRWHGKGKRPWFDYRYEKEELEPWVPKIEDASVF
jgi:uncharacterized protein YecE (DUF72 family)